MTQDLILKGAQVQPLQPKPGQRGIAVEQCAHRLDGVDLAVAPLTAVARPRTWERAGSAGVRQCRFVVNGHAEHPSEVFDVARRHNGEVPVSESRSVVLLGSTGSIGTQAIDVITRNPGWFTVTGISAGGSDLDLLARQAVEVRADHVGVAKVDAGDDLAQRIAAVASATGADYQPTVHAGDRASEEIAGLGADVVLNGITGAIGLRPTLAALAAGSTLALANKESLIIGGELVTRAAAPGQIVPVDSEHSAIAQALRSGRADEVRRLVLTASGGPFRGRTRDELADVTPEQALAHPNFSMGKVITTNSATLVNKGLEVIEAHLLFGIPFDRIQVVVHPEQQIHSMVEFHDGSTIAQAGPPRMLVPIALGLSWPDRLADVDAPCDWTQASTWHFEPLDDRAFPAVDLARRVGQAGGTAPAVYNATNEVAVEAFHDGRIGFLDIVDVVTAVVEEHTSGAHGSERSGQSGNSDTVSTVEQVLGADAWARDRAIELLNPTPLARGQEDTER